MGKILQKLARKIIKGSASEAERRFFDAYYDAFETKTHLDDALTNEERISLRNQIDQRIQSRVKRQKTVQFRKWSPYVAASILLAALCSSWFFLLNDHSSTFIETTLYATEVLPGGNRATLTLANGQSIALDETKSGVTVGEETTYSDGSSILGVREISSSREQIKNNDKIGLPSHYSSLTTPKGGIYKITLSDGTQVWLNAASTLTYPDQFAVSDRVVELTGEAYFVVTKDGNRPFKVTSSNQEVVVHGTEFNISAYPGTSEIKTTLVGGSVTVVNLLSNHSSRLNPGEQARVIGSAIKTSDVNVESQMAWRDGFFYFDNVPSHEAIEQIARWYDLDVEYEDNLPATFVFGMVERTKPLSAVLKSLSKNGLTFEIKSDGLTRTLLVSTGKT